MAVFAVTNHSVIVCSLRCTLKCLNAILDCIGGIYVRRSINTTALSNFIFCVTTLTFVLNTLY